MIFKRVNGYIRLLKILELGETLQQRHPMIDPLSVRREYSDTNGCE